MFWGCHLKENQPYKYGQGENDSSIIYISNATLVSGEKGSVKAKIDGQEFVITKLNQQNKNEKLDLYFRKDQNVQFLTDAKGEVHLSGYFEESDHEDEEEDVNENVLQKAQSKKQQEINSNKKEQKNKIQESDDEEEDDEDDEDDDDEEDDDDDEEDEEDDDDDEEDEEDEEPLVQKKQKLDHNQFKSQKTQNQQQNKQKNQFKNKKHN